MKRIYKIMRDKKGEGYIDAAVVVFWVMFVIALGVRTIPVYHEDTCLTICRRAGEGGRDQRQVGSETTARQRTLEEKQGYIQP